MHRKKLIMKKVKRQMANWENISNLYHRKSLLFLIYKQLLKSQGEKDQLPQIIKGKIYEQIIAVKTTKMIHKHREKIHLTQNNGMQFKTT